MGLEPDSFNERVLRRTTTMKYPGVVISSPPAAEERISLPFFLCFLAVCSTPFLMFVLHVRPWTEQVCGADDKKDREKLGCLALLHYLYIFEKWLQIFNFGLFKEKVVYSSVKKAIAAAAPFSTEGLTANKPKIYNSTLCLSTIGKNDGVSNISKKSERGNPVLAFRNHKTYKLFIDTRLTLNCGGKVEKNKLFQCRKDTLMLQFIHKCWFPKNG